MTWLRLLRSVVSSHFHVVAQRLGLAWLLACALPIWSQQPASQPDKAVLNFRDCVAGGIASGEECLLGSPAISPQDVAPKPTAWQFPKRLLQDQESLWRSPFRMHTRDLKSVLPFLGVTAALMAADNRISRQVPASPDQLKASRGVSSSALAALAGAAGITYVWGDATGNHHRREAGVLSAEAAINGALATLAVKSMTQRSGPPEEGSGSGFFQGGRSFPSQHSALAWSVATVLAHEYPRPLNKFLFYGLASATTVSRVTGKEHFASDAMVGSALGWYLGRHVYRAHHGMGTDRPPRGARERSGWQTGASINVPLDSWTYPAFERLAAWGYLRTGMLGQRPWTREQCARLVEEVREGITSSDTTEDGAAGLYRLLAAEFAAERKTASPHPYARLDSLYTRVTGIVGPPLTDGYNFARTIVNDAGRPIAEGLNSYAGITGHGAAGPFAVYVQAEYQHSPSARGASAAVREAVAQELGVSVLPAADVPEIDRGRVIEAYVTLAVHGLQISFGKQALAWGPTAAGSLVWSTNAEPIPMLRISSRTPFRLPSILRWLGPVQTDSFLGQLSGQQYILEPDGRLIGPTLFHPQPYVHGQKLSFKPVPDLEIGLSRTVTFSGMGRPFTVGSFWNSFSSLGSDYTEPRADAGDRHSGFDVTYHVPGLRKWLTVYTDAFCEDDVLPLAAPSRCAWAPGFYVAGFPRLPKLDFRAEGVFTDASGFHHTGAYYHNVVYPDGYTNRGNILGSWVGRQGRGVELWSTYWFSAQSKLTAGYRRQDVDRHFLQGGGLDDVFLRGDFSLKSRVTLSGSVQREGWNFPLLANGQKSNWSVSVGVVYRPNWEIR